MSNHKTHGKKLRETFNLRAKPGQVIRYSQADKDLQGRMKKHAAPVSEKPESFEALMGYGSRAVDKLGRVETRMTKLQEKFNAIAERMETLFNNATSMDNDPALKAVAQAVEQHLMEAAMGVAPTATEEQQQKDIAALQDAGTQRLRTALPELKAAQKEIEELLDETRRTQRQRRDASRELGIHIGGSELLSKGFDGKYLQKAAKKFGKSGNDKHKEHLKNVVKNGDHFQGRLLALQNSRESSLETREELTIMREMMKMAREDILNVMAVAEAKPAVPPAPQP